MKVLVTGGSTKAMIDKVRCIGNIFKGRTALAIAGVFGCNECDVTVLGTSEMQALMHDADLCNFNFIKYRTYKDLYELMESEIKSGSYDVVVHSAAVSDYQVSSVLDEEMNPVIAGKVSSSFDKMYLELTPTAKIIDLIRGWGFSGKLVKFKLEVGISNEALVEIAKKSMLTSHADYIVANCLEWSDKSAMIIDRDGAVSSIERKLLPSELLKRLRQ